MNAEHYVLQEVQKKKFYIDQRVVFDAVVSAPMAGVTSTNQVCFSSSNDPPQRTFPNKSFLFDASGGTKKTFTVKVNCDFLTSRWKNVSVIARSAFAAILI